MARATQVYTTKRLGILARIRRYAERSGSISALIQNIAQEVYVRACDRRSIRRFIGKIRQGQEPEQWVFLVGCYNSGTTLLQNLLIAHPDISGMPREGVRFTQALSDFELNDHHMFWDKDWRAHAHPKEEETSSALNEIKADWSVFWNKKTRIFLEKSISNTGRIAWLQKNFPNAKFIGLHRNGYCIAEGLHRRNRSPQWLQSETGLDQYPIEMVGQLWVDINTEMLNAFDDIDNTLLLSFENLVENPQETLRIVFDFIGLDKTTVQRTENGVSINSKEFEIFNPNPASLKRLTTVQRKVLEPLLSTTAMKLGYTDGA